MEIGHAWQVFATFKYSHSYACRRSVSRSELDHQLAPVIKYNAVVLNRERAVWWDCYNRFRCVQLYRYDQRLSLTNQAGPNAEECVGG